MKKEKMSLKEGIWLFTLGCLLGFILETVWHIIKYGTWINKQGLLYGPFKPIYGFGLIIIVLSMYKFRDKKLWQKFIIGVVVGSAFEYFGSLFQEYIFGTSTWNYSRFNMNISGRIYLPYCIMWGIISVLCIDYLYPYFLKLAKKTPPKLSKTLTYLVGIFMIINVSLTSLAIFRYSERAHNKEANNYVFKFIDNLYDDEYMQYKFPKLEIIKK